MLKANSPLFEKFGEIYFSEVLPGVVKGWKRHKKMTQLFAVPVGMIKLVVFDSRDTSGCKEKLMEIELGRDNYRLVKIPPKLWYGFQCTSEVPALLANCADMPHDPKESETRKLSEMQIKYEW